MNVMKMIELLIVFFICAFSAYAADEPLAGGPCEYKQYKGQAKIISITQKRKPHNYPHEIYEVKFAFNSDQEIQENFAQTEGKEFVLLLNNSNYPGPKFLEKYEIQVGKVFDCHMKVITRGTCTPVVFEFPTIRFDDYFEN
ncbi:MAG: hypothetical protein U9N47_12565 [Thermodesulfobacteriota bacterium]|nr:hypothetical protein [Thermodesulfobacteriota bacterium]